MLPIPLPDKNIAMLGAFFGRFAIGFLIPLTNLSIPSWKKGVVLGTLLSLPDAIITNAFAPIMITGIIGGLIMGIVSDRMPGYFKQK